MRLRGKQPTQSIGAGGTNTGTRREEARYCGTRISAPRISTVSGIAITSTCSRHVEPEHRDQNFVWRIVCAYLSAILNSDPNVQVLHAGNEYRHSKGVPIPGSETRAPAFQSGRHHNPRGH